MPMIFRVCLWPTSSVAVSCGVDKKERICESPTSESHAAHAIVVLVGYAREHKFNATFRNASIEILPRRQYKSLQNRIGYTTDKKTIGLPTPLFLGSFFGESPRFQDCSTTSGFHQFRDALTLTPNNPLGTGHWGIDTEGLSTAGAPTIKEKKEHRHWRTETTIVDMKDEMNENEG